MEEFLRNEHEDDTCARSDCGKKRQEHDPMFHDEDAVHHVFVEAEDAHVKRTHYGEVTTLCATQGNTDRTTNKALVTCLRCLHYLGYHAQA